MLQSSTLAASAVDPKQDPAWEFAIYIPGHARAKGSQERRYMRHGSRVTQVLVERDAVLRWVATASAYALQERRKREAHGDTSFPYEAPVKLYALFVYDRPPTQPTGPPITKTGKYAVGDLDKLLRAVGDALAQGEFSLDRGKVSKAGIVKDDSLITRMGEPAKAFRDETLQYLPAGAYLFLRRAPGGLIDGALYGFRSV